MKIEVSNGEIFDKYAIAFIKSLNIKDPDKLKNIYAEKCILEKACEEIEQLYFHNKNEIQKLRNELYIVNMQLWEIEDAIRKKEKMKEFDAEFIRLARSVYIKNDERSLVKRKLNECTNSTIKEEKSYETYN